MSVTIRAIAADDRPWVRQFLRAQAGDTAVVSRGVLRAAAAGQ